jgi:hypothetical protein
LAARHFSLHGLAANMGNLIEWDDVGN